MPVVVTTIARIGEYDPGAKTVEMYFLVHGPAVPIKVLVPAADAIDWPRFLQFVSSKNEGGAVTMHDAARMEESWRSKARIIAGKVPGNRS